MTNPRFERRVRRAAAAGAMAFVLFSAKAVAGLYPPAAPPGSAFVRIYNATLQGHLPARVGDKSFRPVAPQSATAYDFLPPGSYSAQVGSGSKTVQLEGRQCYTLVSARSGLQLLGEPCFDSQLSASLSVYNLMDDTELSVRIGSGDTVVFDRVQGDSVAHRTVNPVRASLAVYAGRKKLADAPPVALRRGEVSSLFVSGTPAAPVLTWVGQ